MESRLNTSLITQFHQLFVKNLSDSHVQDILRKFIIHTILSCSQHVFTKTPNQSRWLKNFGIGSSWKHVVSSKLFIHCFTLSTLLRVETSQPMLHSSNITYIVFFSYLQSALNLHHPLASLHLLCRAFWKTWTRSTLNIAKSMWPCFPNICQEFWRQWVKPICSCKFKQTKCFNSN